MANFIISSTRRAASKLLGVWLVTFMMAMSATTAMVVETPEALAQDINAAAELEGTYDDLQKDLKRLSDKRDKLEAQYKRVTDQITQHKRGDGSLLTGLKLESLLEEGRVLANRLYAVQDQIRKAGSAAEEVRVGVVAVYDQRVAALEQKVLAGTIDRAQGIKQLNRLTRERHKFRGVVESTVSLDLAELPTLNDVPSDPEEMLAAAAELDDTERKVKQRISELDASIAQVEKVSRVRRRAKNFRDRESLFDDALPGARRVNTSRAVGGAAGDSGAAGRGTDNSGGDTTAGAAGPPEAGGNNAQNEVSGDDSFDEGAPSMDADGVAEPTSGAGSVGDETDRNTADPSPSAPVASPTVGPTSVLPGTGGPSDPFAGGGIVVKSEVDTDLQAGTETDGETLNVKIKRLKQTRRELEGKARELRSRSDALKMRAGEF